MQQKKTVHNKRRNYSEQRAARMKGGRLTRRHSRGKQHGGNQDLLKAASDGNAARVEEILAADPSLDANEVSDGPGGATPLYIAAQNGHTEVVKLLLAIPDIDVNKGRIDVGATPLFTAAQNGHTEVVKFLLARSDIDVNEAITDGTTPLFMGSQNGHTEIVKLLLARPEIDVNKSISSGATPLYIAAQNGHTEVVKLLLTNPDIDVNKGRTDIGATALYIAAQSGHTEVVKLLLTKPDVDVNKAIKSGSTPLYTSSNKGYPEIVKLLMGNPRIVVDAVTKKAMGKFDSEIVDLIMSHEDEERNIPFNATNAIFLTPIHNGNRVTNFDDESKWDRYYTTNTYRGLSGKNPFTRKQINASTVKRYKAAVKRSVPVGSVDALTGEAIADGNAMANFFEEADAGRFYKRETFNSQIAPTATTRFRATNTEKKRPLDRDLDVKYYRATVGGRSTRRSRR